jgi:hypothetical protein
MLSARAGMRESHREVREMPAQRENDPIMGELYLAGERVPPGVYWEISSRREVRLEREDYLPASLDGRVACYQRIAFVRWDGRASEDDAAAGATWCVVRGMPSRVKQERS